jgi:hypothetical protein
LSGEYNIKYDEKEIKIPERGKSNIKYLDMDEYDKIFLVFAKPMSNMDE